ncbi:(deoxy)nucleoside triphosphate pyrophosphohydrolase [Bacillus suaedae]|uniref:8-oxo-dGTP diphosphatase n=1 Tax=Halalkalibacter suaedae TaxID=2822140 RepID=A0A940WQM2_9BACI|nr:(deoxy)nucleoside triphosphate pyrophosphohydrolase [Bacillus suaedae]MBP3950899.1 (deoxy)nucleoside triphosphate pyrophosphohydrolase [Bacillus suaedae]
MKKTINVVAAIIENEQNEILCALRSPQMSMPNLWEFPGGKVEKEEDIYTSITREIKEELACEIEPITLFHENVHEYESIIVNLFAITSRIVDGVPVASEHAKLLWLKRENLSSLRWALADIPAVKKLIDQKDT